MKQRSEPPKAPEVLRDEIVGLGSRSLRKNYFGKLQQHVADLARFRALLDVAGDAIIVARLPELEVVDGVIVRGELIYDGELLRRAMAEQGS